MKALGTATQDFSANGFEGEVKGGAKWIDGQFGKALQFAAAADHVLIEDDAAFHLEGAITQSAWVQLDRLPGAHAIIFGTRQSGATRHIGFGFGMNPGNGIKVWTNGAAGGFKDINDNATKLGNGQVVLSRLYPHRRQQRLSGNLRRRRGNALGGIGKSSCPG